MPKDATFHPVHAGHLSLMACVSLFLAAAPASACGPAPSGSAILSFDERHSLMRLCDDQARETSELQKEWMAERFSASPPEAMTVTQFLARQASLVSDFAWVAVTGEVHCILSYCMIREPGPVFASLFFDGSALSDKDRTRLLGCGWHLTDHPCLGTVSGRADPDPDNPDVLLDAESVDWR